MATLFRRRDENDQENEEYKDVEGYRTTNDLPPDTSLQEPGAKIWIPYLNLADKYDKDLVHNWRDDMDSLLIFAALFSASVTAFVIESYNNLVQDTGEVTISVLLQISQQIANGTQAAAVRPSFQPASIDIAINVLWFLSLAFSLTCALAAVLVRQWARQYLRFPRSFSSTSEQARARQFAFENMEWWKMDVIVEMIPALLHISLILFFIGLLLFVRSVSYTLAVYLLCFSTIGGAVYALLTTTPLVFSGCPYKTPFTGFLGLCVKGGTPLFQVIWIGLTTFFVIIGIPYTMIKEFALRCFPSLSSRAAPWGRQISPPTTSHLERIIGQIRATDVSSRSMLAFLHNIRPSIQRFLQRTRSFLELAISSLRQFTQDFSVTLRKRQQEFRDELTIRDAHALQWVMEYSKRDADLLDIVTSVPEFVELNNSAEVRKFMWRSGVFPRAVQLLCSCAPNTEVAKKFVRMACLEAIVVLAPCSTAAINQDSHETFFLSSLMGTIPTQLQTDIDIAQLAFCAISNIVLRRVYELESSVTMTDEGEFKQQAKKLESAVSDVMRPLYDEFGKFGWRKGYWYNFHIDHYLLDWGYKWHRGDWTPIGSIMTFCESLRSFRSAWATAWIKFYCSTLSSVHHSIWKSLADSTTHLQEFPYSTRDSQHGIFTLVDKCFRMASPREVSDGELSALYGAYNRVIYGHRFSARSDNRSDFHTDFTSGVHVYWGDLLEMSPYVEIPFEEYITIINELSLFVRELAWESNEPARRQWDSDLPIESAEFQDASAVAIRKMIHCRTHECIRCGEFPNMTKLDSQHLIAARTLRMYSGIWKELIERTAVELGYSFQLHDDYDIDVHAELQFYDSDLFLQDSFRPDVC